MPPAAKLQYRQGNGLQTVIKCNWRFSCSKVMPPTASVHEAQRGPVPGSLRTARGRAAA